MSIKVLLADDQVLLRSSLALLIAGEQGMELVGEAGDGEEAVALARSRRPDVILMDVRMPGVDGLEATAQVLEDPELQEVRVIVLTTFELDEYVIRALRAGASGFLLKGLEPAELLDAVRLVAAGDALLAPSVTRRLLERFAVLHEPDPEVLSQLEELTPRESEILTLVGTGLSNSEIAAKFVLSPLTVKTHVNRVMAKLAAHDRAQLVIVAYEAGLVRPSGRSREG